MRNSKPWETKNRQNKRKINVRRKRERLLIVCEGSKTEPNYFNQFSIDINKLEVKIIGKGYNTDSLVEEAIQLRNEAADKKNAYNQVWCVFDKNSFPTQNFNRAIQLARDNKIRVAYSNQAFEIWYLLHFEYFINAMSRDQYRKKLEHYLKHKYSKNSLTIYNELKMLHDKAVKNAEKLFEEYNPSRPASDNPSTTVHLLVKELNKRLRK